MTLLGALVFDVVSLILILWLLNLVRLGRLYVGYGIVLLFAIAGTAGIVSVPAARALAGRWLHVLFPGAELIVVMWLAFVLILIYLLAQLTRIVYRLSALVQELALRDPQSSRNADEKQDAETSARRDG